MPDPFSAIRGPSPSVVASMFGVPVERVRQQYARNARQLRDMASKALATGKPCRGYSAGDLNRLAMSAEQKAKE